jgi:ABC-type nitrate/sulfonate/bicarbonate transport system ATPase subunit
MFLRIQGKTDERHVRREMIELVGLRARGSYPHQLSGGQQQRWASPARSP